MMNIILMVFISGAVIFSLINGTHTEIFNIITDSLNDCSLLIIKIAFLTGFFSGIMKIAEKSGLVDKLCGFIRKIISLLFKTKNKEAKDKIALNISANMIGIGNAATPAGLMAMKELDKDNKKSEYPSYDMCKFMMFNTCSVQLIPTTVMALRSASGSQNPSAVILPVLIVSFLSLVFALLMLKLLYRKDKRIELS